MQEMTPSPPNSDMCPNYGKIHPKPPDFSEEAKRTLGDMQKESDRGLVIVSAAHFESELERLIREKLPDEAVVVNDLFRSGGPLDSFSSKIKFAFTLGIISRNCFKDLDLIRRIRNDFAHCSHPVSFSDSAVTNRCSEFATTKNLMQTMGARDAYILTAWSCQIEFLMASWKMDRLKIKS